MSKVLNRAQALSLLAGMPANIEVDAESCKPKGNGPGQREPADAIIARFDKAMKDGRKWTDNCPAGVVYGD